MSNSKSNQIRFIKKDVNLWLDTSTGLYHVIAKVGGKNFQECLDTKLISIARNRRDRKLKEQRELLEKGVSELPRKLTFGQCADRFFESFKQRAREGEAKFGTLKYYRNCYLEIKKTWPGIENLDLKKIRERDCFDWAERLRREGTKFRIPNTDTIREGISPSAYNGIILTFRNIFDVGIKSSYRLVNPAKDIPRRKNVKKTMEIPSDETVRKVIETIRSSGSGWAIKSANAAQFLLLTGRRINEAVNVTWGDIDWEKQTMIVRGHPETGSKGRAPEETFEVPILPELFELLKEWRLQRSEESDSNYVLEVKQIDKSLATACRKLGIPRLTHHSFRHVFTTVMIEAGHSLSDVADLLGHQDGGNLLAKTYRHPRLNPLRERVGKTRLGLVAEHSKKPKKKGGMSI